MRSCFAAIGSFIIPGLGQLFSGMAGWAIVWFGAGLFLGPIINIFSAAHAFFAVK